MSAAWEEFRRARLPHLARTSSLGRLGPWGRAARWWHGDAPEWDVVSESVDGDRLLLGEAKWAHRPLKKEEIARAARSVASKTPPALGKRYEHQEVVRALFVPELAESSAHRVAGVVVVTCRQMLR